MPKAKSKYAELNPNRLSQGFIPRIRMQTNKSTIGYVLLNTQTGEGGPVTPVGKPKNVKKPVVKKNELASPASKKPVDITKMVFTTPEGKTKLNLQGEMGAIYTPTHNTRHSLLKLSATATMLSAESSAKMQALKQKFLAESTDSADSADVAHKTSAPPEFRGGSVLLTAKDVQYRVNKNKKTGGHRTLVKQPKAVMKRQSAKDYAQEQGFLSKQFNAWDWGHLLPAGGSPQGAEVNLDPYNFLAVPATLNTWQMVPEMMARHLAEAGFDVDYTCLARAEKTKTGKSSDEFSFIAKEIYCSVKLRNHGLKVAFFTSRDDHQVPNIMDAAHYLSEFYKVAGKPNPTDLKEKFNKALNKELKELKELKEESFISPGKKTLVPAIKRPYMAPARGLIEEDFLSVRPGFKPLFGGGKPCKKRLSEDDFAVLPPTPKKKAKL